MFESLGVHGIKTMTLRQSYVCLPNSYVLHISSSQKIHSWNNHLYRCVSSSTFSHPRGRVGRFSQPRGTVATRGLSVRRASEAFACGERPRRPVMSFLFTSASLKHDVNGMAGDVVADCHATQRLLRRRGRPFNGRTNKDTGARSRWLQRPGR